LWVGIDEKGFVELARRVMYQMEAMWKYVHMCTDVQYKVKFEKAMFLGAVAKPRPQQNFDGRIL